MKHCGPSGRRRSVSVTGMAMLVRPFLVLAIPLTGCQSFEVAEPATTHQAFKPPSAPGEKLTLCECLQRALLHHPRVAAQRASLAAAEDGARALESLRFPATLDPQVPVRRRQACLGRTSAAAAVDQAEREVRYAVTRAYFTVVYAREQETVARNVVERLTAIRESAEQAV